MENPTNPAPIEPNHVPPVISPTTPNEDQEVQPPQPDTEVNPGERANNTEVDLDRGTTKKFPDKNPPERH